MLSILLLLLLAYMVSDGQGVVQEMASRKYFMNVNEATLLRFDVHCLSER